MIIDFVQLFTNTLSGILGNIHWFLLAIWAVRKIVREMPSWLRQYHDNNIKEIMLQKAVKPNG